MKRSLAWKIPLCFVARVPFGRKSEKPRYMLPTSAELHHLLLSMPKLDGESRLQSHAR